MAVRPSRKKLPIPRSEEELDVFLARIAENLQILERTSATAAQRLGPLIPVLTTLNEQLQLIKTEQAEIADPLNKAIMDDLAGVLAFVQKYWDKLTTGKTLKRPAGLLRRREGTKETILVEDEDAVIEWLEQNGHEELIRRKSEVNREAMHQDLGLVQTIPGVTVFMDERLTFELGEPTKLKASEKFSVLKDRLLGK